MVLSWLVTQPSTDEEIEVLDRTGTVEARVALQDSGEISPAGNLRQSAGS